MSLITNAKGTKNEKCLYISETLQKWGFSRAEVHLSVLCEDWLSLQTWVLGPAPKIHFLQAPACGSRFDLHISVQF